MFTTTTYTQKQQPKGYKSIGVTRMCFSFR